MKADIVMPHNFSYPQINIWFVQNVSIIIAKQQFFTQIVKNGFCKQIPGSYEWPELDSDPYQNADLVVPDPEHNLSVCMDNSQLGIEKPNYCQPADIFALKKGE
jgi:hypothetical protein